MDYGTTKILLIPPTLYSSIPLFLYSAQVTHQVTDLLHVMLKWRGQSVTPTWSRSAVADVFLLRPYGLMQLKQRGSSDALKLIEVPNRCLLDR